MSRHRKREPRIDDGNGRRSPLTISEASQYVGIHRNTLRRWSAVGLVRVYRIGSRGDRRYKIGDLNALVAGLTRLVDISHDGIAGKSFWTIGEASRHLDVHANTLRRWTDAGLVKAYRIGPGRRRMFTREDIGALLLTQKRKPA